MGVGHTNNNNNNNGEADRKRTNLVDLARVMVNNPSVPFIKYHVVHLGHQVTTAQTQIGNSSDALHTTFSFTISYSFTHYFSWQFSVTVTVTRWS